MRLINLRVGSNWTVYAICEADGSCPLLDFVDGLNTKLSRKVLSDLQQFVPNSQPSDWVRCDFSKKLNGADDIYEFCWPTGKGGTPRVFWFYDRNKVIVCTHGLDKKGTMNAAEVDHAIAVRAAYVAASATGAIETMSCDEFLDE